MSFGQFFFQVGDRQALVFEQYEQVVDQVSGLRGQLVAISDGAGQRGFHTFLTDLLGDALWTFRQEACGPAVGGISGGAESNGLFQARETTQARRVFDATRARTRSIRSITTASAPSARADAAASRPT